MSIVWDKICELFTALVKPTRRKARVSFSPSTLHREIMCLTKMSASSNPFFNFLTEVRMKAQCGEYGHPAGTTLSVRESARIAKTASRLWNFMSDEQKLPYRNIALEQRKLKRLRGRRKNASRLGFRRRKRRRATSTSQFSILVPPPPALCLQTKPIMLTTPMQCDLPEAGTAPVDPPKIKV